MFFELGSKRIEKKKKIFKEIIFKNNILYDNIITKILSQTTDEYNNIKKYLIFQVASYNQKIDEYNEYDEKYNEANNYVNTKVYLWLTQNTTQYYNQVVKYEQIVTMWDFIGLFIECGSLFTDMSVKDIGALYYNYENDSVMKVKLINPIPSFIKFNDISYQSVIISFENDIAKKDKNNNSSIHIQIGLFPVDNQESPFYKIINKILIKLFLILCKKFCDLPFLFNDKYYVIDEHNLHNQVKDGYIFFTICLNYYYMSIL